MSKIEIKSKIAFIPDTHAPYHDKRKFNTAVAALKKFKPDILVVLGDFADCYSVSDHSKSPDRERRLEYELYDVNLCLDGLDSVGAKRKEFIMGNHEDRFDRYIANRAPELHGLVSIADELHLKERKWNVTPYKSYLQIGKLYVTHDCGHAGKYAHYQSQDSFQDNIVIGHTHRLGYTVVGNAKGVPHVAAMFGWLGDVNKIDYEHRVKVLRNSAHGFGIGYLMNDGCVHIQPVPFVRGGVVIEGIYTGEGK